MPCVAHFWVLVAQSEIYFAATLQPALAEISPSANQTLRACMQRRYGNARRDTLCLILVSSLNDVDPRHVRSELYSTYCNSVRLDGQGNVCQSRYQVDECSVVDNQSVAWGICRESRNTLKISEKSPIQCESVPNYILSCKGLQTGGASCRMVRVQQRITDKRPTSFLSI